MDEETQLLEVTPVLTDEERAELMGLARDISGNLTRIADTLDALVVAMAMGAPE